LPAIERSADGSASWKISRWNTGAIRIGATR
jgi:hypothetical protein